MTRRSSKKEEFELNACGRKTRAMDASSPNGKCRCRSGNNEQRGRGVDVVRGGRGNKGGSDFSQEGGFMWAHFLGLAKQKSCQGAALLETERPDMGSESSDFKNERV